MAAKGKASTIKKTFSRETNVNIVINASPDIIWKLLTTAADMSRWNSTIISLEGDIKLGETVKLKSILDENRIFKLKVKELIPNNLLVWGDSQGSRSYNLIKKSATSTSFSMTEKIGSIMFPLYSRFIPLFDESFEQFAADLKKEAEHIQHLKGT